MNYNELNIFEIENLDKLNTVYNLYSIIGLKESSEEFDVNKQKLAEILSRKTSSPCILIKNEEELFIAQPDNYEGLDGKIVNLFRNKVELQLFKSNVPLDYNSHDKNSKQLCIRFLQFDLNRQISKNQALWRPSAGKPFYQKSPKKIKLDQKGKIDLYNGFSFRIVKTPTGKLGISIDITTKYISKSYLPFNIEETKFKRMQLEGRKCIYEFGQEWFEITISGYISSRTVSTHEFQQPDDGWITVYDYLHNKTQKPLPISLVNLPKDCSVITYITSIGDERVAPSGLCKLSFSTDDPEVSKLHKNSIKKPLSRRTNIELIAKRYFRNLYFNNSKIVLSKNSIRQEINCFSHPDLIFGGGGYLSINSSISSIVTSYQNLGKNKMKMLYDQNYGYWDQGELIRQYIVIPKSVDNSYGKSFVSDIIYATNKLYPKGNYKPKILVYNDLNYSVKRNPYKLANVIIKVIEGNQKGYLVIMIPEFNKNPRTGDKLANILFKETRKLDFRSSIIHTTVSGKGYYLDRKDQVWKKSNNEKIRGQIIGYLKNVALNKILLLNKKWPFVLGSKLSSDLTIGIDVKNHTSGFTLIYKDGSNLRFEYNVSKQNEQLSSFQLEKVIYNILKGELELNSQLNIDNITIHRDGKLFQQEKLGIENAIKKLKKENLLSSTQISFMEILKTSFINLRLFYIMYSDAEQKEYVKNPTIGSYLITDNDAFLWTTGYPYKLLGSSKPLHIIFHETNLSKVELLEDLFYLSCLTWMKPDACQRIPMTIKMTDINLLKIAGEYDEHQIEQTNKGEIII